MKILTGKVVTNKMKNAVTVEVSRMVAHPLYLKRMRRSRKMHAANQMTVKIGDMVKIQETRPMCKTINWKVIEVIKKT